MKHLYTFFFLSSMLFLNFNGQAQDTLIALVEDENQVLYYINQKGEKILSDGDDSFSENLLKRSKNYKYGFINWKNEWVIEPIYKKAENFSEGFAKVFNSGKWGY